MDFNSIMNKFGYLNKWSPFEAASITSNFIPRDNGAISVTQPKPVGADDFGWCRGRNFWLAPAIFCNKIQQLMKIEIKIK